MVASCTPATSFTLSFARKNYEGAGAPAPLPAEALAGGLAPAAWFDAHVHAAWAGEVPAFVGAMPAAGLAALAVTVEPAEYERLAACLEALPAGEANALVAGLGLHPWYVSEAGLAQFLQWAPQARLLGEVGLDAAPAHLATFALQRRAFACVAHEAARENHVLSIHAVRAASEVLELLQEARAFDTSTCIFHWFSGSSAELTRCREAGAWFSVSHRMLASKRGRAYAQALPKERLLLETDLPAAPGEALTPAQLVEDLAVTLAQLAEVRKVSSEELKAQLAANAAALRALV